MASEESLSPEEAEARVRSNTVSQHQEELGLIRRLLNTYLDGFRRLDSFTPSDANQLEYAWLLLTTRSFNSMRCAYDLLQRGYYSQAITLIRSVNEDWLTCNDCRNNQATLDALLKGGKMPKFVGMKDRLEEPLKQQWWDMYGEESQFAHARHRALKVLIDPETHTLALGGHYDRDLFIASCYSLIPAAVRMTEFLVLVLGPKSKLWAEQSLPIIQEAKAWMRAVESEVLNMT